MSKGFNSEKVIAEHKHAERNDDKTKTDLHFVAAKGHAATDAHGHSLVHIDPKVESTLRLKLDLCIVPTVSMLYLFCFIDRANIGNAKLAGFEEDLGLEGRQFNIVLTCFYLSYIIFEIPSNICCKWLGPGWFIPGISMGFGIISICNGYVQNFSQACAVRFLLGVFEAGVLPGIAYYLSRWYKRAELSFRLSLYMIMAPLAGAFGSLLASGILKLDSFGNVSSWRMIFVIEGIITVGLSVMAFFTLTDRPETAIWLTEDEKDIVIARVKSERVATTAVLDKMDRAKLWKGILNPVTLIMGFLFLLNNITVQGLAFFLPTIVSTIYPDYSVVRKQLLSAPPYLVGGFFLVFACWLSWRWDRRVIFLIVSAPPTITGYAVFLGAGAATGRYIAAFLVACSTFWFGPLSNAIISANVVSDTARSSGIGMNVMLGNVGGLISTWTWLPEDAPKYRIGHGINLAVSSMIFLTTIALLWFMKADNKKRQGRVVDRELAGLTQQQVEDLDWKHPAFKWQP